jgi:septum formation protein
MLGMPTVAHPSDADESTPADWPPERIVQELAQRKARAVRDQLRERQAEAAIVIGSDTIVAVDGEILGKPRDEADAIGMLSRLSGRTHDVFTGVCCIGMPDGPTVVDYRRTAVRMRKLTEEQIRRYVASGEPLDKAGGYGIQGLGSVLVDSIEGCYFTVVGLPLSLLASQLEHFGVSLP